MRNLSARSFWKCSRFKASTSVFNQSCSSSNFSEDLLKKLCIRLELPVVSDQHPSNLISNQLVSILLGEAVLFGVVVLSAVTLPPKLTKSHLNDSASISSSTTVL